jgi:ABC-type transport system involved in multi-copper enzyme maturation permease subunit
MRSQLLSLLRNELVKAARRKLPWFGFFCGVLLCGIVYAMSGALTSATANGWTYVAFSMQLVFSDVGPVFIVVFSAMLLSEETGTGTMRALLGAPVYRWELYIAKAITGLIHALLFSIISLLCSIALARWHHHFGAVGDTYGVVYGRGLLVRESLFAYGLSLIPLFTLVMYGLLLSTIVRTPGAAVSAAVSTLFIIDFTKHLAGLDAYIFTRYFDYPWMTLQLISQGMEYQWVPEVWKMIGLCGVSAAVMFLAGLITFVREDLNH